MRQNEHYMFTWICPNCGGAVDVAEDICPHCAKQDARSSAREPLATAEPVAEETVHSAPAAPTKPPAQESAPEAAGGAISQSEDAESAAPASMAFSLQKRHYLIFAGGLAVAVLSAIWLSGGFSGLRLEGPEEMVESPVEAFAIGVRGPIEVSGIRPYYDEDFQTHVRAFVANHSKQEQPVALRVHLRVREASRRAPPLATFEVIIGSPLPPNGGQEIDVRLQAMGSLQSLPKWDELRVDLEAL